MARVPKTASESPLRALPSVDQVIRTERAQQLGALVGLAKLTALARNVTENMRAQLNESSGASELLDRETLLDEATKRLEQTCQQELERGLRRVINATGVVLHTNLGRAPLSESARQALVSEASGYCTLEYDSTTGARGRRGARVEQLLRDLTGAEDALVVNNCAAASLLILTVLANSGETIVSRGELVEIGGDFRVPDVMASSGTRMVEVGTTNRTTLEDYTRAINSETRLLMRVHPSNYRVIGFTSAPSLSDLSNLAHQSNLLFYLDAGSGALLDLSDLGLGDEPIIANCIAEGVDIVSFSGDKLLGATQAGLMVGRTEFVWKLRKHPFYRALRVDKLCYAALEATLAAYARGTARSEVPTLSFLSASADELTFRASRLADQVRASGSKVEIDIVAGNSAVGGGSGPNVHPETTLLALTHAAYSASEIEQKLRSSNPPIISRIEDDRVLLDLRTTIPSEETEIASALSRHFS